MTDASIISISTHCNGLQSLNLWDCHNITDASIISISENSTGLKRLDVVRTRITDACLVAIAKNCTGLQYLVLMIVLSLVVISCVMNSSQYPSYELSFCLSIPAF